ncbi:MAG: thioredoxin family protein [Myxococcales bacterium]|nr:MAG: thioredoxin family protein [Myxococcales bacterium]
MKRIEILGTGCPKCKKLFESARQAVKALGIEAEVVKIEDIQKIMSYGVMMTPGLVVDGTVKTVGKVPSVEEIKKLIG